MHVHKNIVQAYFVLVSVISLFIVVDGITKLLIKILKLDCIIAFEILAEVVFRVIISLAHS